MLGLRWKARSNGITSGTERKRRSGRVRGVEGVTNAIEVKPRVAPTEIRRKIEDALRRAADIDATHVTVETNGSEVILRGTVRSWAERQEAEKKPLGQRQV